MKDEVMNKIKEYLFSQQDLEYLEFSKNLNIAKTKKSIGVRLPIIRSYARTLLKEYSFDYLIKNIDDEYYEEILLRGFIIGNYRKLSSKELIYYIDTQLFLISDWSMCDSFVTSLKLTKKYPDEIWKYLLKKLESKKEFKVRFALVMILNYYICDDYKNNIYKIIESITNNEYYIKMANAWLLSYMFINYFDDTISFVKKTRCDSWVVKKGITKAIESYKINDDQKNNLRKLRDSIK